MESARQVRCGHFHELHTERSAAAKALRVALGTDPLKADVFKEPHHMSKHGLNLELVEQVSPALSLVSSVAVSQDALREALQATSSDKVARKADHELGIHYTSATTLANR